MLRVRGNRHCKYKHDKSSSTCKKRIDTAAGMYMRHATWGGTRQELFLRFSGSSCSPGWCHQRLENRDSHMSRLQLCTFCRPLVRLQIAFLNMFAGQHPLWAHPLNLKHESHEFKQRLHAHWDPLTISARSFRLAPRLLTSSTCRTRNSRVATDARTHARCHCTVAQNASRVPFLPEPKHLIASFAAGLQSA